jgi:hypothetical protein
VPRLGRKDIIGNEEDVKRNERDKQYKKLEGDLHSEARAARAKLSSGG